MVAGQPLILVALLLALIIAVRGNADDGDAFDACQWERPQTCHGPPTYKIQLHFVKVNATSSFPIDLRGPVRAASELWSRAIVGTRKPARSVLTEAVVAEACGDDFTGYKTTNDGLLLCVHYHPFDEDHRAAGTARAIAGDTVQGLPRVARIDLNARFAGELDSCDWANVAAHEMGHALGFASDLPSFQRYLDHSFFRGGSSAQREWDRLNTSLRYPALEEDGSHWSRYCFANEMMLPGYDAGPRLLVRDRRDPLSSLTLAVFADLGYQVNYGCTDKVSALATCNPHNYRRPRRPWGLLLAAWPRRLLGLQKLQVLREKIRKQYQILRYRVLMIRTSCLKLRRRFCRAWRKRASAYHRDVGHAARQVRKSCRRWYRRLRRAVRAKIRRIRKASICRSNIT